MNSQEHGSTRARIQTVALELFAEQGYDKTSLREIADRLGVTKAALYYHFKTKEEIVVSTVEDFIAEIDKIIAWGDTQPHSVTTRREVMRRYADVVVHRKQAMRFFHQNPALETETISSQFRERMGELQRLLHAPDAAVIDHVRAIVAVTGLHVSMALLRRDPSRLPAGATEQDMREAAITVALELVGPADAESSTTPDTGAVVG